MQHSLDLDWKLSLCFLTWRFLSPSLPRPWCNTTCSCHPSTPSNHLSAACAHLMFTECCNVIVVRWVSKYISQQADLVEAGSVEMVVRWGDWRQKFDSLHDPDSVKEEHGRVREAKEEEPFRRTRPVVSVTTVLVHSVLFLESTKNSVENTRSKICNQLILAIY